MKNSAIEWCDHTFNPWEGCTKVSPGCAHCYAETRNARFGGGTAPNWGKGAPRRRTSVQNWNQVRRWNREAGKLPPAEGNEEREWHRPRVFCASLADWLDDEVPVEWLADLLALVRECRNLDWLLLSKRPQNWKERLDQVLEYLPLPEEDDRKYHLSDWILDWYNGKLPANVWIGTTVEDQQRADERIPELLKIHARVRFLSCEPLLGPVDLGLMGTVPMAIAPHSYAMTYQMIHWVICGGESGHNARPMHPNWARSLRDQCKGASVPFLFKQWGEWAPREVADHVDATSAELRHLDAFTPVYRIGKKAAGRLLDGIEHTGFPS